SFEARSILSTESALGKRPRRGNRTGKLDRATSVVARREDGLDRYPRHEMDSPRLLAPRRLDAVTPPQIARDSRRKIVRSSAGFRGSTPPPSPPAHVAILAADRHRSHECQSKPIDPPGRVTTLFGDTGTTHAGFPKGGRLC